MTPADPTIARVADLTLAQLDARIAFRRGGGSQSEAGKKGGASWRRNQGSATR